MNRISIKGVALGGLVDVLASMILLIPLAIYAISNLDLAHIPTDHVGVTVAAAMNKNAPIYVLQLAIGSGCSLLGGYLAGRLAKHDELLNGALSSFLCVTLGLWTVIFGKEVHSLAEEILLLVASPTLGLVGGYISLVRRKNSIRGLPAGSVAHRSPQ